MFIKSKPLTAKDAKDAKENRMKTIVHLLFNLCVLRVLGGEAFQ